jgi:hypothetical protein
MPRWPLNPQLHLYLLSMGAVGTQKVIVKLNAGHRIIELERYYYKPKYAFSTSGAFKRLSPVPDKTIHPNSIT